MRISAVMGIILCSCLAYIACGSGDDGGQNPVATDGDINSGAAPGTDGDGNNAETPNTDSDADNTETPDADGIVDITGALFTNFAANCATYANCYVSLVVDVQNGSSFAGNLKITVDGDKCLFASNAIPNHDFNASGNFATLASAQEVSYEISAIPTTAASVTYLVLGDDAVFLNGVKLDLLAAACYDVGSVVVPTRTTTPGVTTRCRRSIILAPTSTTRIPSPTVRITTTETRWRCSRPIVRPGPPRR